MKKLDVQIGQRFTRLTVISESVYYNKRVCRQCRCDCGQETYVREYMLISGGKRSCGCLRTDLVIQRAKAKGVWSKYFPLQYMSNFRKNARIRDIDWGITIYDLDIIYERQNGKCYYTGQTLTLPDCKTDGQYQKTSFNVSIDRIDSDIGYIPDNICLCLKQVNVCKHILHRDNFIKLCHEIATYDLLRTGQQSS